LRAKKSTMEPSNNNERLATRQEAIAMIQEGLEVKAVRLLVHSEVLYGFEYTLEW
jgi:hypothetical protein